MNIAHFMHHHKPPADADAPDWVITAAAKLYEEGIHEGARLAQATAAQRAAPVEGLAYIKAEQQDTLIIRTEGRMTPAQQQALSAQIHDQIGVNVLLLDNGTSATFIKNPKERDDATIRNYEQPAG